MGDVIIYALAVLIVGAKEVHEHSEKRQRRAA